MAHSLEARVPFLDPVVTELRARARRRGTRCAGFARSSCCARRPRRCSRASSCGGASAASRSRPRPGCAATSSRSPARRSRPETLRRQGFFRPEAGDAACSTTTSPAARTASRQLWGLLAFTLWHERHVERTPRRVARAEARSSRRVKTCGSTSPASAHVLVFRPLIGFAPRAQVTRSRSPTRDYAQTLRAARTARHRRRR